MEEARGGCHSVLTDKRQTLEDWRLLDQVPTLQQPGRTLPILLQDGGPGCPSWAHLRWLLYTLSSLVTANPGL